MSILVAAGIPPVKGTQDQVLKSIAKLLQVQKLTAFSTAGTATILTLTPSPAIDAYETNQRFRVKFNVNSGLNPTINVSNKGSRNLKQYDSAGGKVAAVFVVGQLSDIEYDGTDWVVLNRLSGASGFQFVDVIRLNGAVTLTAAGSAGCLLWGLSTTNFNVTLPAVSSMPAKSTITFANYGYETGGINLLAVGADLIFTGTSSSSLLLAPGDSATLGIDPNGSGWIIAGGIARTPQATETKLGGGKVATQTLTDAGTDDATIVTPKKLRFNFAASFVANGYLRFPSWLGGLTLQWGSMTSSATAASFPIAFANACLFLGGTPNQDSNSGGTSTEYMTIGYIVSASQFKMRTGTVNGVPVRWFAIGY